MNSWTRLYEHGRWDDDDDEGQTSMIKARIYSRLSPG